MSELKPWHDCPVCPHCDCAVGTPCRFADRWIGPDHATLFCPACGAGWVGTADDVAKAERAQAAWEEQKAKGLA